MTVSLTGFMGCGKSSIGRALSQLLCCPFMDLDEVIEKHTGMTIPEIFASQGEEAFRRMEAEALNKIICNHQDSTCSADNGRASMVIALGGGTVMTPECAEIVHEKTLCIYMRASADTLLNNLRHDSGSRPMLGTHAGRASSQGTEQDDDLLARITALLKQRSSTYEKTAHIIIDTDGKSISATAGEIFEATLQMV